MISTFFSNFPLKKKNTPLLGPRPPSPSKSRDKKKKSNADFRPPLYMLLKRDRRKKNEEGKEESEAGLFFLKEAAALQEKPVFLCTRGAPSSLFPPSPNSRRRRRRHPSLQAAELRGLVHFRPNEGEGVRKRERVLPLAGRCPQAPVAVETRGVPLSFSLLPPPPTHTKKNPSPCR